MPLLLVDIFMGKRESRMSNSVGRWKPFFLMCPILKVCMVVEGNILIK